MTCLDLYINEGDAGLFAKHEPLCAYNALRKQHGCQSLHQVPLRAEAMFELHASL